MPLGALGGVQYSVKSVETGVDGLSTQDSLELPADDQHGGPMHEGPHRQHESRVFTGFAAETFGDTLANEIERGPGLV